MPISTTCSPVDTNEVENSANVSNISGWHDSRHKLMDKFLDVPRNTMQALVLIIYRRDVNEANKFRSTLVKNTGVMRAYGRGEFLGQAVETSITSHSGGWDPEKGFGLLGFDSVDDANKFLNTKTEVRDWLWLGGVEIYIVPCCNPCKSFSGIPICSIEMHDVKSGEEFSRELQALMQLVSDHGGLLICATSNVIHVRGVKMPGFIVITQWPNSSDFQTFSSKCHFITGSCGTRIVAEIEPFSND